MKLISNIIKYFSKLLTNKIVGQIFGIFAKSKGTLIKDTPIKADEESHYSLASIFADCDNYIQKVLSSSRIEQARKEWLKLIPEEEKALKFNNIEDFADEEIEYQKSINESLNPNFFAIGMTYDDQRQEIIYSKKYQSIENWPKTDHLLDALYKIKEVLFEDLKMTIESKVESDDKRLTFENIQILLTTVRTLKELSDIDEVALVYGPY